MEKVYLEEKIFDGSARLIEEVFPRQQIKLDFIPAVVFINDGLSEELKGESEIESLMDFEEWYSKLGNADADAERKSMNPTKYLVDMANNSTKNLSTAAGALWDLGSDQNLENPNVMVGLLEPEMYYSEALKTTLDRIKTTGYEQVDMPNITNESLSGVITSGKALKAIYWPLIVRCKEKMKMWGPNLTLMTEMIIKGAMAYPNTIKKYTNDVLIPVDYKVEVVQNTPLPEDEIEEKTIDLAEVEAKTMSRKTFMKKWRGLTTSQVTEELEQIALERQIIEDASFGGSVSNGMNGDNNLINGLQKDDFTSAGVNSLRRDGTQGQQGGNSVGVQQVEQSQQVSSKMSKLNGTQIGSLISILGGFKVGNFTRGQAKQLIMSMGLDDAFAEALLKEEEKKPEVTTNA
ncbi:MAG: phage portal protein [Lachnospiraceae bacterium]|nr:phage portal protein [Lachnospiraceae bacterium]